MSRLPPEDRPRKPIKGVRLRFRTAVRAAGVKGRFNTDFTRGRLGESPGLHVYCSTPEVASAIRELGHESWEGYPVRLFVPG